MTINIFINLGFKRATFIFGIPLSIVFHIVL